MKNSIARSMTVVLVVVLVCLVLVGIVQMGSQSLSQTTIETPAGSGPARRPPKPTESVSSAAQDLATSEPADAHLLSEDGQQSKGSPSVSTATATVVITVGHMVSAGAGLQAATVPIYTYEVVNSYPHDAKAFTQGLIYEKGFLYEGTGLRGESTLRKVELESGRVLHRVALADRYFGEGIVLFAGRIYQLTWRSRVGFTYDLDSFTRLDTFHYATEGWGLTHDGAHLIMSDGTHVLAFRDPGSFEIVRQIQVLDQGVPVTRLNELEFVEGEILANVWQTDRVARIDPSSGAVSSWIDLTGLLSDVDRTGTEDVLNGIAYDAESKRLFVTGKLWPKLFEIRLVGP